MNKKYPTPRQTALINDYLQALSRQIHKLSNQEVNIVPTPKYLAVKTNKEVQHIFLLLKSVNSMLGIVCMFNDRYINLPQEELEKLCEDELARYYQMLYRYFDIPSYGSLLVQAHVAIEK